MTSQVTDAIAQTQNDDSQEQTQSQSGNPFESGSGGADQTNSPSVEVVPVEVVDEAVEADQEQTQAAEVSPESDKPKSEADPFKELGLRDDVYKAIKGFGYETPTAIQKETVSVILEGRDVIGQAETGSGKTAAFAWPLLSQIDLKKKSPQILVLAPTRELALQVLSLIHI